MGEPETAPASPMDPSVLCAVEAAAARLWPGVAVVPLLELGGSDGRFLRAAGIPTFGASGVFLDVDDVRAHGRDERVRAKDAALRQGRGAGAARSAAHAAKRPAIPASAASPAWTTTSYSSSSFSPGASRSPASSSQLKGVGEKNP